MSLQHPISHVTFVLSPGAPVSPFPETEYLQEENQEFPMSTAGRPEWVGGMVEREGKKGLRGWFPIILAKVVEGGFKKQMRIK